MNDPEPLADSTPSRLRWYHFRLRTLVVLMAVFVPIAGTLLAFVDVVPPRGCIGNLIGGVGQVKIPDNSKLPAEFQRLVPLHRPLGTPRPGDWLTKYAEPGQSYDEYVHGRPIRPDGRRRVIYIQPLGDFNATQRKIVQLTGEFMGIHFQLPVRVQDDLPLSLIPEQARRKHPEWGDSQILTGYVCNKLLKPRLPDDAVALVAFTTSDLWPGEGWNFVFGEASLRDRVGVWSMARFGDPDQSPEIYLLVLRRTLATAVHETGHMFSMEHCVFYECLMCGANHLSEADRHPLWPCPQCLAKLCYATGATPVDRFKALIAFAQTHGLNAEAAFWTKSLEAMQER